MRPVITKYRLRQIAEDYILLPVVCISPFMLLIGAWLWVGYDTPTWARFAVLGLMSAVAGRRCRGERH